MSEEIALFSSGTEGVRLFTENEAETSLSERKGFDPKRF